MSARRYIAVMLATLVALAAVAATVNIAVDTYLVFGSARVSGFNKVKTEINSYVRTAKAYEPFRSKMDVLIAGNSRVEMGLNPDHFCFTKLGQRVYNLGIPGAGVGQQLNYVVNVIDAQPVKRIILSIDFVDFLVVEGTAPPVEGTVVTTGILPLRFDGSRNPDYSFSRTQTRFQALLSLNALIGSFRTVVLQGPNRPDRLPNGFNPAQDFASTTIVEGPGALFEQKMSSLRERLSVPMGLRYSDGSLARDFELLSHFLDIAARRDIEVYVLTNPFHEQFWELLRINELEDTHADWLLEIERRVRVAAGDVTLWDFSMDSEFIHESVPSIGTIAPPLDWFWEPSHYRKELGDKMIESMFADECGSQAVFGIQYAPERSGPGFLDTT